MHEARVFRCRLDAHGINTHCPEETIVQGHWGYIFAMGGLRIQVADADVERAMAVLEKEPASLPTPSENCPTCGSDNTELQEKRRNIAIATVVHIGLPILPMKDRLICHDCTPASAPASTPTRKDGDEA